MSKDLRELSFLRDLYINENWTKRFTDMVDEKFNADDIENLLYLNAGTGEHCFALREKISDDTAFFGYCEDEHLLKIAREKAAAISSDIDFSMLQFEGDSFDKVITDATFAQSDDLEGVINDTVRVVHSGGEISIMLVSAGSFGEVFSMLWEIMADIKPDSSQLVEDLISKMPTLTLIEDTAKNAGIVNVKTQTALELFDFENGKEFLSSPLVEHFLIPEWLKDLDENEKEQVKSKLAQLIDSEEITFIFSVKATLLTGEKE